jgi:hypothetical protein
LGMQPTFTKPVIHILLFCFCLGVRLWNHWYATKQWTSLSWRARELIISPQKGSFLLLVVIFLIFPMHFDIHNTKLHSLSCLKVKCMNNIY